MDVLTLTLSTLYGDHHVTEVRRLLLEIPGVEEVYASSCFRCVRVTYDPAQVDSAMIGVRLNQAGYLQDLRVPSETGTAVMPDGQTAEFRHTAACEQTGGVIGFTQNVRSTEYTLWPCPGMGGIGAQEGEHGEERA